MTVNKAAKLTYDLPGDEKVELFSGQNILQHVTSYKQETAFVLTLTVPSAV